MGVSLGWEEINSLDAELWNCRRCKCRPGEVIE